MDQPLPVLADEYMRSVPLCDVFIANIKEKKYASAILK